MKLEFSLIPYAALNQVIPALESYLQKSEAWTRGRASTDDIVGFLFSQTMALWMVYDLETGDAYGYVITETKSYPRLKLLVCQYCAGEEGVMKLIDEKVHRTLQNYAIDTDCDGIEFYGRPGWRNFAHKYGYNAETVVYEKIWSKQ